MNFIKDIINKIKRIFKKSEVEKLDKAKEVEVEEKVSMEEDALEEKKLFTNFKISDEVLNLALEYEKKKKEIKNKENELASLNFEIDRMQNKKV